ncbi:hypothetical protein ACFHYQ_24805 [Sphaerimonospora cavernae]|uniref:Uncharacterized protein n=1 Tax=Sphaerimonospora cavernae TaxID=1740611 RepID=A0ABV6UBL6_9ACTN
MKEAIADLQTAVGEQLDQLSSSLGKTVQRHVREALKAEVRQSIEAEVRAEITDEIRKEMTVRLNSLISDYRHLDPAKILEGFLQEATNLLSTSPQPAADSLTQRELVEGLRQAVLEAFGSRRLHLAHLAELDSHLREATDLGGIRLLVDEWFAVAGLKRIASPVERSECFATMNSPTDGPYLALVRPAYVDAVTHKIVRSGQLRHTDDPASALDDSSAGGS